MSLSPVVVNALPKTVAPTADPAAAHAEVLPLIDAVTDEQLVAINLNIPAIVSAVLEKAPRLASLTGEASLRLRDFDPARLLRLPTIALALAHAHMVLLAGTTIEVDEIGPLYTSALTLRTRLMDDLGYMIKKGVVNPDRLGGVKGLTGYRNVAFDLLLIETLLQELWSAGAPSLMTSAEDAAKGKEVGKRILQALSAREQVAVSSAQATTRRHKAYSLLFHECAAIEGVVTYLRWEQDDAADFAPSVFDSRRAPRKPTPDSPEPPVQPAAPGSPPAARDSSQPVVTGMPSGAAVVHPAPAVEEPVPLGHQGGSPFLS